MLPSHYADPAGNQVAIPDADSLLALIRSRQIDGQTWVLTDAHADWVNLHSLPEWPHWLATAQRPPVRLTPLPELEPGAPDPIRWPVKLGWLLLGLALLIHFGLFYYTRGHFTGVDFFEEAGALVIAVAIAARLGQFIQNKVNASRAGQKPPMHGILLLTMSLGLMAVVAVMGIGTWSTFQTKGAAGLAFEDSMRGVDEKIQGWAKQMHEEYNAIYDELDQQTAPLDVKGLETKPGSVLASEQAARDGERRARQAAESFQSTATKLRTFVKATDSRLQRLQISAALRAKQQKAYDEEFAAGYLAEADFLAAKGAEMAAMADLFAFAGDLMAKGEFTWTGTDVQIKNQTAGAEYDRRLDVMLAKQGEADRLYKIMVEKNS
ncbi:MAG TPA: hypothetical protein VK191_04120 [Symbiobacteriaceae bacterium]|nr:hypothetical protein [Symbiobacteriaceae bacterium]